MTDLELLEKYEPVLRFARSERFFPMDVEHYLELCALFPSGPQGAVGLLSHLREPLKTRIGKLPGHEYYLRFVNKTLIDSDVWIWLGALTGIGCLAAWFLAGIAAVEITLGLALMIALVIFMLASPIRLRIIPAVLAAAVFVALELLPIWFFLSPHSFLSVAVEYLLLLPVYVLALFYFFVRTMKFILDRIIPEGPGLIMDMLSQSTERIAREAFYQYEKILEKDPQPVYYGRVVRQKDEQGNSWTALQYHFFYAFNDWRLAANGMNHHEGDWEMTAVYLKNDEPYAVLFSQHGAGNLEYWQNVRKAVDKQGKPTTHAVVYVALGSHANYSRPEVIRSPNLYRPGSAVQRLLYWVDGWIHYLFLLINPSQKARQIALQEIAGNPAAMLAEDAFIHLRDEADHYVVSLPMEIATGDGYRVGYQGDNLREGVLKSSSYLKRIMSDRRVTRPQVKEWRRALLSPEPEWVQYKGLWGVKSWLAEESGPPGPKWDRVKKDHVSVEERVRWAKPLEWLAMLEAIAREKNSGRQEN